MYHEEKMIDGVLHWRGTPDGQWRPYSQAQLSSMLEEKEKELCKFRTALERIAEMPDGSIRLGELNAPFVALNALSYGGPVQRRSSNQNEGRS